MKEYEFTVPLITDYEELKTIFGLKEPYLDINQFLSIEEPINKKPLDQVKTFFMIGNNGTSKEKGVETPIKPKHNKITVNHPIPLKGHYIVEDTPEMRETYCLRKIIEIQGIEYVFYYGKYIDVIPSVQMQRELNDTVENISIDFFDLKIDDSEKIIDDIYTSDFFYSIETRNKVFVNLPILLSSEEYLLASQACSLLNINLQGFNEICVGRGEVHEYKDETLYRKELDSCTPLILVSTTSKEEIDIVISYNRSNFSYD